MYIAVRKDYYQGLKNKFLILMVIVAILIAIIIVVATGSLINNITTKTHFDSQLRLLQSQLNDISAERTEYKTYSQELTKQLEDFNKARSKNPELFNYLLATVTKTNRGGERVHSNIKHTTAYTAGFESTGKHPGDKGYGVTASGAYVQDYVTIAAGKNIPFGTVYYIPALKDDPNGGIRIVQDRGGAIGDNDFDIYIAGLQDALDWGVRDVEAFRLT